MFEPTEYDLQVYEKHLRDFLPQRIIDVHAHLWKTEMERVDPNERKGCVDWPHMVSPESTIEDLQSSYKKMFPGKDVSAVLFGMPTCKLDEVNRYTLECAKKVGFPALFCTNWDTTPDELYKAFKDGFVGIKPYLNNCPPYIPTNEVRIYDFVPHEHLEVIDELGGIVMLHIPRSLRLRDPVNIAQMMDIEKRYKNARIIYAHIGRAYTESDLGDAFETLKHSENMVFDFTANCLPAAITACLRAVGPKRLLFGSDMPITKMRMYRTTVDGHYVNVVPRGAYGDVSGDKNMAETDRDDITTFMYEELLAFEKSANELKLSDQDIEDVMAGNTMRMFGIEK